MTLESVNEKVNGWVLDAAPNLKRLMATQCLEDLTAKRPAKTTVEWEQDLDLPVKGVTFEFLPLPVTHTHCKTLEEVRGMAKLVGEKLEETLLKTLGEASGTVRANRHEAESVLAANGFYGPYEQLGDFVMAVNLETIRVIVALHPRVRQDGDKYEIECIVVPNVRKAYRGEVGVEKIQSK